MSNLLDQIQEAILRGRNIAESVTMHPATRDRLLATAEKPGAFGFTMMGSQAYRTVMGLRILTDPKLPRDRVAVANCHGEVIEVVNMGEDKEVEKPA